MREAELERADRELGRFIRKEWAEARRLGYPTMSAFAKDIARGTVAPAVVEHDPEMEAVGAFYHALTQREKETLAWWYLKAERGRVIAERHGVNRRTLYKTVDSIKRRCADYLVKHT